MKLISYLLLIYFLFIPKVFAAPPSISGGVSFADASTPSTSDFNIIDGISDSGTLTATELLYVDGVTSAIQTQLNAKESSTSNNIDPDRLSGDTTDDDLVDAAIIGITTANIEMDGSPATDDTYKTFAMNGTNAGEAITQWDCVYFDRAASEWMIADNTAEDTGATPDRPKSCEAIATAAGTDGAELKVVTHGPIRNDVWNWSIGIPIYLSTTGDYTQTRPTASGSFPQEIGVPLSADVMFFAPKSVDYGTTRVGTTADNKVLTCLEASNTVWSVSVDAKDITLPAVAECPTVATTLIVMGAISTDLDVNANDRMVIDGVANADGHKATSTGTTGDQITCVYYDADGPICQSNAWTQE